ncbi:hypothetical protein [Microbispora sp. GKU 823]|uniref:hypothetical protein n=1 Tax=Microbispora sp. GKU 823 TaxID=1652100 RepID=UPI0009A37EE3|nr:hypothetical protein [Microbispora sp. GKU 823]OPG13651.1 hypothetical protein B1L11_06600 [Microbispora sp. GKU 823]
MFTIEQAPEVLPVGTRVRHRYRDDWAGTVAPRPEGKSRTGQVYDGDVSGWCVAVNVEWDDRGHLWTNPRELAKLDAEAPLPDVFQMMAEGLTRFSEGFALVQRTMQASGAMGLAYRGDLDQLRAALAELPAEQVREISAAAALLASTADEVLTDAG